MRHKLTARRLRKLLHYAPRTGRFYWRVSRGNAAAGFEAGTGSPNGYRTISIDGRIYLAHRLAWLHVHGRHPAGQIDHINSRRADNRIKNLRDGTRQQNLWHRRSRSRSGLKGVTRRGAMWSVRIWANGKETNLGFFPTRTEAKAAYATGALILRGSFAATDGRRARTHRALTRSRRQRQPFTSP